MRKSLCLTVALLLLLSIASPLSVRAQVPVDPDQACTLELEYSREGVGFVGMEVRIYRIADIYADGSYALIEPFSSFPVTIHGFTSQKEWHDAADTLAAYIVAQQLSPTASAFTGENGTAAFSGLTVGVYLVMGYSAELEDGICTFENFCIFLPAPQSDGTMRYDVTAKPKSTFEPKPEEPELLEYRVMKLWKEGADSSHRPDSITVDILRNGAVEETVVLSPENNWSYSWTAEDNGDVWTVVEKDVPEEYTVVITNTETCFVITNTRTAPPDDPPYTGDDISLGFWTGAMVVSGLLLVLTGIWRKRTCG